MTPAPLGGRAAGAESRRPVSILLATRNAGKLRELRPLVAAHGFAAVALDELGLGERPEEAFIEKWDTFEENALAKAQYFAALATEHVVLAEDSGLCVNALGGAPGVHSRRWGGDGATDSANNARLLAALGSRPDRAAAYVCCAVLLAPEAVQAVQVAEGRTVGRILEAPCGTAGFGYDPLFWSDELSACFGGVSAEAKAGVSHRTRAVERVLKNFGPTS